MAFIVKFFKGVRNHWKKSAFAVFAVAYGTNYAKEYFETQQLMRTYCEKALKYGKQPIAVTESPRNVTVILNPNANRRKALKLFENYCAPILHLAGVCVDVIQTQSEGHAKTLAEELKQTDAVVIAGGDGTISEVITGLMRRPDRNSVVNCPIGVLPLGRSSSFARSLFPGGESLKQVKSLADAAMAVVEENVQKVDVMKIEVKDETESTPNKPVYAIGSLEWGAYRDAQAKRDKYWYFGPLRNYVTYIFNGFKSSLSWNCTANIKYSSPCEGCQNCYAQQQAPPVATKTRWWQSFVSLPKQRPVNDYSNVVNDECTKLHSKEIATTDLLLTTSSSSKPSQLNLTLGPSSVSYSNFVSQGWQTEKGQKRKAAETIKLKEIEILPKNPESKETWFSIDKEDYELKPVKITLLPKILNVFCKNNLQ